MPRQIVSGKRGASSTGGPSWIRCEDRNLKLLRKERGSGAGVVGAARETVGALSGCRPTRASNSLVAAG